MSTLAEIEKAAATLPRPELEMLLRHLSTMLRAPARSVGATKRPRWPVLPPKVSKADSRRVQQRIEDEFGQVESESWQ